MANPFKIKGKKECDECGTELFDSDLAFFHNNEVICEQCAEEAGVICGCGNYKKEEYDHCYTCNQEGVW